jgi:hypothetical protein
MTHDPFLGTSFVKNLFPPPGSLLRLSTPEFEESGVLEHLDSSCC